MNKLVRYILIVFAPWFSGCSSNATYQELMGVQADTHALLQTQSEKLVQQQEYIDLLQYEQGVLLKRLSEMQQELGELEEQELETSQEQEQSESVDPRLQEKDGSPSTAQLDPTGKVILGRLEWVWFDLFGASVRGKMDTGVKSSHIVASQIQLFERDGKSWVRFVLSGKKQENEEKFFEAPVLRKVNKKPVVKLKVKVGELAGNTHFILYQRESSRHSFVLGRSFLRDIAVVDVAHKYTQVKLSEDSAL